MAQPQAAGLRELAHLLPSAEAGPAAAPLRLTRPAIAPAPAPSPATPAPGQALAERVQHQFQGGMQGLQGMDDPIGYVPLMPGPAKAKSGLATKWSEVTKGRRGDRPVDGLWYKTKRAMLNIACNIDLPFLRRHTFKDGAPAAVKAALQPGDILLRRTDFTSGNYFIPSWWKHAAVYTGDNTIHEAAFKGLRHVTVDEFFEHGDDVMVVRMKDLTPEQRQKIAEYAKAQEGKPYDFDVDFVDEGRMSCTELAYQALQAATGRDPVGMGTFGEVTGDRFMNPNFDLVWTSNPKASGVMAS